MGIVESLHQVVFHWIIDDLLPPFLRQGSRPQRGRGPLIACLNPGCSASRSAAPSCSSGSARDTEASWPSNVFASIPPEAPPASATRSRPRFATLLAKTNLGKRQIEAAGIGFGGPVDVRHGRTQKSFQIDGWDDFPLADWIGEHLGVPRVVLENDADTAGLAEARFGAGIGHSPLLYMTVGSGIGGALIVDHQIYRGFGQGAIEIGHLRVPDSTASGSRHARAGASGVRLGHCVRRSRTWPPENPGRTGRLARVDPIATETLTRSPRLWSPRPHSAETLTRRRSWIEPGRPWHSP